MATRVECREPQTCVWKNNYLQLNPLLLLPPLPEAGDAVLGGVLPPFAVTTVWSTLPFQSYRYVVNELKSSLNVCEEYPAIVRWYTIEHECHGLSPPHEFAPAFSITCWCGGT